MSEVRWLDEDEMEAWRLLLQTSVRLLDRLDADLQAAHGLSLADYEVLVHLAAVPEARLRMSELATRALASRSRLTHAVDRLAKRDLVQREQCEKDRRGWYAVLTPQGRRLLETAAPTHVSGVRRYVLERACSKEELAAFTAMLGKLAEGLDEPSCPAPPHP